MSYISNSELALRNDERELLNAFDTNVVKIDKVAAPTGIMVKYKVTVNAPTHYLENNSTDDPKSTDNIVFYIEVLNGYPNAKPRVYYPSNKRLASVNVFFPEIKNDFCAAQCTDEWHPRSSSLFLLVEKTVRDIIHDPCVCRYDSMANPYLEDWHRENVKKKNFPTVDPGDIYKKTVTRHLPPPEKVDKPCRNIPLPERVR